MSYWNTPQGRIGLAAWKMERADLRAGIIRESDERADGYVADRAEPSEPEPAMTPTPDTWSLRCRCGELATHEIVYVWDGVETRRLRCCDVHFAAALDAPAVDGLRVLVVA